MIRVHQIATAGIVLSLLFTLSVSQTLQFQTTAHLIPHPLKIQRGGEDAFFNSSSLLIVADGVGGWNNLGVDPGMYSRFLCSSSQIFFNEDPQFYKRHPLELIIRANKHNSHIGSSTMSVVTLKNSTLKTCHIGDCKLYILRRYRQYRLIFQSVDQLHGFNFPFQLALEKNGGDDPKEALCSSVEVRNGDLVILASDGMSDNIFSHELAKIVEKSYTNGNLKDLAISLAQIAVELAKMEERISPFSAKAREWGVDYKGGKVDDTTVIVAQIVNQTNKTANDL